MPVGPVYDEDRFGWATAPAITDASPAAAAPTKAEFDALVAKFNALLAAARDINLIALD